jgi:hypothetical protein
MGSALKICNFRCSSISFLHAPSRNFAEKKFLFFVFNGYHVFLHVIFFMRFYFLNFTGLFIFISLIELLYQMFFSCEKAKSFYKVLSFLVIT